MENDTVERHFDKSDGMPEKCVLSLDSLSLVRTSLPTDRLTTLDASKMEQVCAALLAATDC